MVQTILVFANIKNDIYQFIQKVMIYDSLEDHLCDLSGALCCDERYLWGVISLEVNG